MPPPPPPTGANEKAAASTDATLYLHPQTLARLGSIELRAKMIIEGVMSGMHRSPYQGFSVEFAQHRAYAPGDDIRHLDWKVYARTDKLQIKQYQQETNLDLVMLVDASGSMGYGSLDFARASGKGGQEGRATWTKFDHATAIAAAMSYITLHQGDRAGLAVHADDVLALVDRSGQHSGWRKIVETLGQQPVEKETDVGRCIEQILAKVGNKCLFVLIGDFFEDPERIKAGLARLRHRGHDAMLFQVLDPAEREFAFDDPMPFDGLEGEDRVRINPRVIRDAYLDALERHRVAVEKAALGFGFDYELVTSGQWLGPTLASFVASRNAKIKKSKLG